MFFCVDSIGRVIRIVTATRISCRTTVVRTSIIVFYFVYFKAYRTVFELELELGIFAYEDRCGLSLMFKIH